MTRDFVAVATFGDPRSPATWSGTSANLIAALESLGQPVEGIDVSLLSMGERIAHFARFQASRFRLKHAADWREQLLILGTEARSDFNLTATVRNRRARFLRQEMRRRNVNRVIHMVPYSIPVGGRVDPDLEHYLVLDGTVHLESQHLRRAQRPPHIVRQLLETEREMFSHVKHFFPLGEYLRDDLVHEYGIDPARVTVIRTGRGKITPYHGEKRYEDPLIFLLAKARFEDKGGPLLLKAFEIARAKNPALKLVIAGRESYKKRLGNIPGVTILGFIPWAELEALFQKAALFAMPALSEPWGLVYLEALSNKTPILGLRRMSLPELTDSGRYGFLVDRPTPEAVAQGILEAVSDPERLRRMGEEGQQWCLERFTWERSAERILEGLGRYASGGPELIGRRKEAD